MRKNAALWCVLSVAGLQLINPSDASAQPAAVKCDIHESGIIRPGSGGEDMKNKGLHGPFLIWSLQTDVDPANPQKAWVVWTRENTWMSVDNFKGPFFLSKDEFLIGRANDPTHTMPRGAVYSGLRCHD